jgi:hypothetical protein
MNGYPLKRETNYVEEFGAGEQCNAMQCNQTCKRIDIRVISKYAFRYKHPRVEAG